MLPIGQIQDLAQTVPSHVVGAVVLLVATLVTLLIGLVRTGRAFLRHVPAVGYVSVGAALFLPAVKDGLEPTAFWGLLLLAGAALLMEVFWRAPDPEQVATDGERYARVYFWAALVLAAVLLFDNLGGYSGILVAWEAPVTDGFGKAFLAEQSIGEYAVQRFLWDDGILSAGHTSLFYGAPTYALFHFAGFSMWTLRIFAAIATLISIGVICVLVRQFFGPIAGGAVALLFAFNPAVLYYGRYGSSPAGTILAVLIAILCTWVFLSRERPAWWMAPLCALTLFLATLQYSPGRLVVLILLGLIGLVTVCQWRRLRWQRAVGIVLIVTAAVGVWRMESSFRREHYFVHARGETFPEMVKNPATIKGLIGRDLNVGPIAPGKVRLCDKVELGLALVREITLPQYVNLLVPRVAPQVHAAVVRYDPPPLPLYYPPFALFILWGVVLSILRVRSWPHACLLIWVAASTVPLLLTNRVDAHRIVLFVIPLSVWAALGVREAVRVMREGKVPQGIQHGLAMVLVAIVLWDNVNLLFYAKPPVPQATDTMFEEVERISGPVKIAWDGDHRDVGLLQLKILERMRRDATWGGTFLPEGVRVHIANKGLTPPAEVHVRRLYKDMGEATLLLAPAQRFRGVAAALQRLGARVAERGSRTLRILRIDAGASVTGVPDSDIEPLPTIVIPPTPTPLPLQKGPQVSLTEFEPLKVEFGFEPPRTNQAWNGPPISIGGVTYDRGLGTHAWTRMTYAVPERAAGFQAIVGLSDTIGKCEKASVTFEVRDQRNRLLYNSGPIDTETPPRPIRVDLAGAKQITLIVTDADDGIDCDHANWAVPAFLLGAR